MSVWPSVAERQAALLERYPVWRPQTLDQLLDSVAAEFPDRPYVIGDNETFSYAQMAAWSRRLAAGLIRRGVQPGEHVAIVMANFPQFVALKFAVSRVGGVAVPINILNRRDELAYLLQQSDCSLLVTMNAFRGLDYAAMLDELVPGWERGGGGTTFPKLRDIILFPTVYGAPRSTAAAFAELDDGSAFAGASQSTRDGVADIIYTSGTTGSPKGVILSHDMLARTAFTSALGRAFEDGRRILFALPMYHVFGYVEGMLAALFVGGAILPMIKFDGDAMLDRAEREGASDILAVPTMTLALIDAQRNRARDLGSLRAMLSSGTRAPERVWDEIESVLGVTEVTTGYGMTEVTASSTVTRPDDPIARRRHSNGRLRDAGPAGDPAIGGRLVEYRVVDPATEQSLRTGSVGELRARGLGVTRGYYKKPEETAAVFDAQGWLRTGDLGTIDADDYVVLAGRLKESYRCGGEQVLPTEIEDVIARHPDVVEAHVVPVPDERMGEVGAAFVVLTARTRLAPHDIQQLCRDRLARFKVPKYVLAVDASEIPTTASGRARKFLLSQLAAERLNLK